MAEQEKRDVHSASSRIWIAEPSVSSAAPYSAEFDRDSTGYLKSGYIISDTNTITVLINESQFFTILAGVAQAFILRKSDRVIIRRIAVRTTAVAGGTVRMNFRTWTEDELKKLLEPRDN